jgi:hypothetical protein
VRAPFDQRGPAWVEAARAWRIFPRGSRHIIAAHSRRSTARMCRARNLADGARAQARFQAQIDRRFTRATTR